MCEELDIIKAQNDKLKVDCEFINYQFESKATGISDSLTNLRSLAQEVKTHIGLDLGLTMIVCLGRWSYSD